MAALTHDACDQGDDHDEGEGREAGRDEGQVEEFAAQNGRLPLASQAWLRPVRRAAMTPLAEYNAPMCPTSPSAPARPLTEVSRLQLSAAAVVQRHVIEHGVDDRVAACRVGSDEAEDAGCGNGEREQREQQVVGDGGGELLAVVVEVLARCAA